MKLLLVRHGETIQNRSGIIQGQQPGELSPLGLLQREKLAERLLSEPLDYVYCSDLARTKATLAPTAEQLEIPITYREDIRERHFGVLEGTTWKEYKQSQDEHQEGRLNFRPAQGENFYDLQKRTDSFLQEIIEQHSNKTVLVMSHGGAIRTMIARLIGISLEELLKSEIHNTSISWLEIDDEHSGKNYQVISHTLNDYLHLKSLYD